MDSTLIYLNLIWISKRQNKKTVLLFRGLQHYHSIHIKYFTIYIIFFWMELFELNYYRKHFIFPLYNRSRLPINLQSSPWCWWVVWKCFLWFSFKVARVFILMTTHTNTLLRTKKNNDNPCLCMCACASQQKEQQQKQEKPITQWVT